MDGIGSNYLIGIGHDIQSIPEFVGKSALREPGIFFTEREHAYACEKESRESTETGILCAKESFYKALPESVDFFWPDLEVRHHPRGAPYFEYHERLLEYMKENSLLTFLSISHSGDYASAYVHLYKEG